MLVPMAIAVGSLCAAFLWSLDVATRTRFAHPWLLFLLPLGGFVIGLLFGLMNAAVAVWALWLFRHELRGVAPAPRYAW